MPRNRVQHQKGLSDDAFERLYPDEEACRKAWLAWRWPELDFGHFRTADRLGVAGHSSVTLFKMPLSMAAR